ncbi:hypothetical protein BAUCODRAFT_42897, partial [Baudoinia panamericana UAMH 10762]
DDRPWVEQYAPTDLPELAVHKRKVADVRQWLEGAFSGKRRKILVLKGCAGTGKTTAVHLIARGMGVKVSEWHNPIGVDSSSDAHPSTAALFEDFISRAGRLTGLQLRPDYTTRIPDSESNKDGDLEGLTNGKRLLLVEEFPNTFSRTSITLQSFRSTLSQYVSSTSGNEPVPIVMIISETLLSTNTAAADSFTAHRLLGPELMNNPLINTIEFNPVAPTILIKALETVVVKEARKSGRRRTPGPAVLKRLAETGDVRSAVSALEFLCLREGNDDTWSSKVQFTKPKKKSEPPMTEAEKEALKLISNRESSLGIFHAVGRVIYNNRIDPPVGQELPQPPAWQPHNRRNKIPDYDINTLVDELGTDISTYIAALHENYLQSCSSGRCEDTLDSLTGCAEGFSDADLLSIDRFAFGTRAFSGSALDSLRQDEMSFQAAVRGTIFGLPSPVHRIALPGGSKVDAHRMRYPTSSRLWKAREEAE